MIETTHYYLIDLENVSLHGLYGMNMPGEGSEIRIFLSNAAHVGTLEVQRDILDSSASIETTFCSVQRKNALDFQLAAFFGAVLERTATRRISIISYDEGYGSLEDYAKKRRQSVVVYRARTIWEAYMAEQSPSSPNMYKKGKSVDFKQIMEELHRKQSQENQIRSRLEGVCEEKTLELVLPVLCQKDVSWKAIYLGLLKKLGKKSGLEIYRLIRETLREK